MLFVNNRNTHISTDKFMALLTSILQTTVPTDKNDFTQLKILFKMYTLSMGYLKYDMQSVRIYFVYMKSTIDTTEIYSAVFFFSF